MYKFYLDGTEVSPPQQDRELSTTIKRNSNLNGLLTTLEGRLRFTDDGYTYLRGKYFDSLCNEVEIDIVEQCENTTNEIYSGVIKINDAWIDDQRCVIRVSVEDNTFFSYINNNKNIEVKLGVETLSKSSLEIDQLDEYEVRLFFAGPPVLPGDPAGGTWFADRVKGWLVFDVMQFILDYVTDKRVELQSDLLSGNGDVAQLFITEGFQVYQVGQGVASTTPENYEVSFKNIYDLVNKLYNVSFSVTPPDGSNRAILRIENEDFFYSETSDYVFTDVKDLSIETKKDKIYSTVRLGSAEHDSITKTLSTLITQPLFGFTDEQFHLLGQCNSDKELNLGHSFQTDSAVIQDILYFSNDFDDSKIIIEVENVDSGLLQADAVQHLYYGQAAPPYYYNLGINHEQILSRQSGYLHNSVAQFISTSLSQQCRVTGGQKRLLSTDPGMLLSYDQISPPGQQSYKNNVFSPWEYDDDTTPPNYNNGGNYNTTTYQYTIPTTGTYSFQHSVDLGTVGIIPTPVVIGGNSYRSSAVLVRVEFRNTTKNTIRRRDVLYTDNINDNIFMSSTIQCDAGDTVVASISIQFRITSNTGQNNGSFGVFIKDTSYFSCTGVADSLGTALGVDTEGFKAIKYLFKYPMSADDFRSLEADPSKMFTFTSNNVTRQGWIQDFKYDHFKQLANITLISSNAVNQDS